MQREAGGSAGPGAATCSNHRACCACTQGPALRPTRARAPALAPHHTTLPLQAAPGCIHDVARDLAPLGAARVQLLQRQVEGHLPGSIGGQEWGCFGILVWISWQRSQYQRTAPPASG